MALKNLPSPPEHLSGEALRLWADILATWHIDDQAHLTVLRVSLEAFDRAQNCRRQIDQEGESIKDRFDQTKPHPLLSAERDSRAAFLAGMKQLGLEPPDAS
jgi:P27 family predicted phage terminase small subunit